MNTNSGPSTPTTPQTIVLNAKQSAQLMEKLKAQQGGIRLITQTGRQQLVAIPFSQPASGASTVVSAAPNITLSPQKTSLLPHQQSMTSRTIKIGSPRTTTSQLQAVKSQPPPVSQLVMTQSGSSVTPSKSLLASTSLASPSPSMESLVSRSGKRSEIDFETFSESKRRKTDKDRKGLRHFSMKVCEKVKAKGFTSYNEVAEELVAELTDPRCQSPSDDQKNIKRRVYDALNVLMAMNIISKEKKEIRWLGLPTNSVQEQNSLETEKSKRIDRIKDKTRQLQELIIQQVAFKNLVERNKDREARPGGQRAPNSAIELPFIIVSTSSKTVVEVQISNDKREWLFDLNDIFETHDDMEVLRRLDMDLGLERGQVKEADLEKAKSLVPKALEPYVVQLAQHGKGSYSMPRVTEPIMHVKVKEDVDLEADLEED